MDADVTDLLICVIKENGISEYVIKERNGSEKSDGYTGTITSVAIAGKDDKNKEKKLYLVVKTITKFDNKQDAGALQYLYYNEIYTYNKILPAFHDLEKEKRLILPPLSPKFYNSLECKTLILENLKCSGYSLYEKSNALDEKHVRLVIEQYGRLHALSFALRDKHGVEFNEMIKYIKDVYNNDVFREDMKTIIIEKCTQAKNALDPEIDADALKIYETFVGYIEECIYNLPKSCDGHSVILHGDCWTKNMMFKYEDQNDASRPTQVSLLDFQFMRMGSPVLDFTYFFYSCSSKQIISELDKYLQIYYDSLSNHMRKLGSDPEKLFPYSVFEEHWKKYSCYGLIFSMFVIYVMLTDKSEAVDLSKMSRDERNRSFNYNIANRLEYNSRVRHIILHFVKNKLI